MSYEPPPAIPWLLILAKQPFSGFDTRLYGFGPDENSTLAQDPGGTL